MGSGAVPVLAPKNELSHSPGPQLKPVSVKPAPLKRVIESDSPEITKFNVLLGKLSEGCKTKS